MSKLEQVSWGERLRYTHVVGGIDAACGGEGERWSCMGHESRRMDTLVIIKADSLSFRKS